MKVSPDGNKITVTHRASNTVRLFTFDPSRGGLRGYPDVFDDVSLNAGEGPYGVEFSPDNTKLYVTIEAGTKIIQYDLSLAHGPTQTSRAGHTRHQHPLYRKQPAAGP
jgi:DNA-binding beta-propeller fold protein YncE